MDEVKVSRTAKINSLVIGLHFIRDLLFLSTTSEMMRNKLSLEDVLIDKLNDIEKEIKKLCKKGISKKRKDNLEEKIHRLLWDVSGLIAC
ncbi:hypothetical protein MUP77_25290 [Candidatus Bathyarchaeota archaeon]|nr:hypothetical protein [Candidatus Bathyarchaeota archaeon]